MPVLVTDILVHHLFQGRILPRFIVSGCQRFETSKVFFRQFRGLLLIRRVAKKNTTSEWSIFACGTQGSFLVRTSIVVLGYGLFRGA